MSDLFHELVPLEFVADVFAVIEETSRHTFQVLTKRPEQAAALASKLPWPENLWLGVSIENSRFTWRADVLRDIPAEVRFVSAEPLLGSLFESGGRKRPLDLERIDWLIAGGESGPGYRPVHVEWLRELRDECERAGVAFFFKQWGGRTPKSGGRELDGETHDAIPEGQLRLVG
jgi:protein gp37